MKTNELITSAVTNEAEPEVDNAGALVLSILQVGCEYSLVTFSGGYCDNLDQYNLLKAIAHANEQKIGYHIYYDNPSNGFMNQEEFEEHYGQIDVTDEDLHTGFFTIEGLELGYGDIQLGVYFEEPVLIPDILEYDEEPEPFEIEVEVK